MRYLLLATIGLLISSCEKQTVIYQNPPEIPRETSVKPETEKSQNEPQKRIEYEDWFQGRKPKTTNPEYEDWFRGN